MRVTINGQAEEIHEGATVGELLTARGLAPVRVAVEINEELVPRRAFGERRLRAEDRVEVVTFVGGG
ncbi:MAG: sulfur carrier protein ThiS [Phycisphaerales bacterium]|nr:sulfur carrier protein ThiS [Phycisphaerales bacterium]